MKTIKKTFIIIVLVLGIFSCKKYPDGPTFSILTKKSRLCNDWKLSEFKKNDVAKDLSGQSIELTIKKDNSFVATYVVGNITRTQNGKWEFINNKNKVKFTAESTNVGSTETGVEYEIRELRNNELRLIKNDLNEVIVQTYKTK